MLPHNLGIREVNANFSKVMKRVQEGQEIIITELPIGENPSGELFPYHRNRDS
jgi:antitoxin (DNA-binding transcriptional repressor) of toxin-antitoxin stability system